MSDREQARLAALLGGDWLCAFDDLLCARWSGSRCTLCGAVRTAWEELRELPCGVAVAVNLCETCHRSDPQRTALDAVLVRRYAGDGA